MTSHLLRNTRLYTRQLNEEEMDILAAWLETLDPVTPGEEAAEVTVVLHHSLRRNDKVSVAYASGKNRSENLPNDPLPHQSSARTVGSQNRFNTNPKTYPPSPPTTRSEGNISSDWKSNSRQMKSFRPPPIFIPGMPNLPEVKKYEEVKSIDERISPEIVRMPASHGTTPVTAIRARSPPTVLSNDRPKNGMQSVPIASSPPLRQNEKQDSRIANWLRNTVSTSSYVGYETQKNSSKGISVLPARPNDSTNDPAILALMTAVVEEKKFEEARTSPRLMGSSEQVNYAHSSASTSSRSRITAAHSRPRGYPYLKSDLQRDTGRLGHYQSDLSLAYS
ncbi:hypothetical protein MFRU_063g00330 [Monilinia fructicola]|nr:hypothetical protein MFRU_063g00330 [Monilinia fructicola]